MSETEELLLQERAAELPPPPDGRYMEAAVRRRLGQEAPGPSRLEGVLPILLGLGAVGLLVGTSLLLGRWPVWLAAFPAGALALCPLLLKRRESR